MKNNKIIKLFTGPYGGGKTTALINEWRNKKVKYCYDKRLFMVNGLAEHWSMLKGDDKDVWALPHYNAIRMVKHEDNPNYFIDDVEIFINDYGLKEFKEIVGHSESLYMSSYNVEFLEAVCKKEPTPENEIRIATIKYIMNIPGCEIIHMKMSDNKNNLPNGYIEEICNIYDYKE